MPAARITTHAVLLTALSYAGSPAARRAVWDRTDADVVRAASALLLSDARWGAYGPSTVRELRGWAASARAAVKRLPADDPAPAATVVVGERPEGITRGPAWRLSGGTTITALEDVAPAAQDDVTALADAAGVLVPAATMDAVTGTWAVPTVDNITTHLDELDTAPVDIHAPLTLAGRPFTPPPFLLLPDVTPDVRCAPTTAPAAEWQPGRSELAAVSFVVILAVALAVAMMLGTGRATAGAPAAEWHTSATFADRDATRQEDNPRWDCHTDGNRLCARFHGPTR